ncbi:MAG: FAD-dependent monooxygenase [Pseudomonadales bacterium]|nr:FAD-dependent monooxygenase [Pseudomonadales bacterium]
MKSPRVPCYDVVIVGGGIAGCALAAALAPLGHEILLVEAATLASALPPIAASISDVDARVSALSVASTGLLREVGAWALIPPHAQSPYEAMRVWEEDGSGLIEFRAGEVRQPVLGHIVENRWIVGALLARLASWANVELRESERLLALDQPIAGRAALRLQLASGAIIDTALLVGADGANSAVRRLCAVGARTEDCGQRAIVATIRTAEGHRRTAWQRFLQTGPLALLPLATLEGEHACSIVWSAQDERARQLMALDDHVFALQLQRACENCLGGIEAVSRRFDFPLRQLHADSYIAPGVALVGDAAHVIHPLAGQGINLGFSDVRVLAEELARALRRGAAPGDMSALARYQRRRRGDNALMLRAMQGFRRLYGADRLDLRLLRNIGMSAVDRSGPLKRQFMRHAMGLG